MTGELVRSLGNIADDITKDYPAHQSSVDALLEELESLVAKSRLPKVEPMVRDVVEWITAASLIGFESRQIPTGPTRRFTWKTVGRTAGATWQSTGTCPRTPSMVLAP
jgi:hypothetical protein